MKLFGVHVWKEMTTVKEWKEVERGAKILIERPETPEEYHKRKRNMVTILLFGKLLTFRIPFRTRISSLESLRDGGHQ